jgi:hypothetical protein
MKLFNNCPRITVIHSIFIFLSRLPVSDFKLTSQHSLLCLLHVYVPAISWVHYAKHASVLCLSGCSFGCSASLMALCEPLYPSMNDPFFDRVPCVIISFIYHTISGSMPPCQIPSTLSSLTVIRFSAATPHFAFLGKPYWDLQAD